MKAWRVITVTTKVWHQIISWVSSIHFTFLQLISHWARLILTSQLYLLLPRGLFPSATHNEVSPHIRCKFCILKVNMSNWYYYFVPISFISLYCTSFGPSFCHYLSSIQEHTALKKPLLVIITYQQFNHPVFYSILIHACITIYFMHEINHKFFNHYIFYSTE
jgi:hypothetical protein